MKSTILVTCLLLSAVGCAAGAKRFDEIMIQKVIVRAEFDFSCSRESLSVSKIDGRTYRAVGCGRKATYVTMEGSCGPWSPERNLIQYCQVASDGFGKEPR